MIECEALRDTDRRTLDGVVRDGVLQTLEYMKCGAGDGHLVVFDRRAEASPQQDEGARMERQGVCEVVVWVL